MEAPMDPDFPLLAHMDPTTLDSSAMDEKISEWRAKRGECITCGAKLFKMGLLGKKKTPMTIPGQVTEGRCLNCVPKSKNSRTGKAIMDTKIGCTKKNGSEEKGKRREAKIPKVLNIWPDDSDNGSTISEITLDRKLRLLARPNAQKVGNTANSPTEEDVSQRSMSNLSWGNASGIDSTPTLPSRPRSPEAKSFTQNDSSTRATGATSHKPSARPPGFTNNSKWGEPEVSSPSGNILSRQRRKSTTPRGHWDGAPESFSPAGKADRRQSLPNRNAQWKDRPINFVDSSRHSVNQEARSMGARNGMSVELGREIIFDSKKAQQVFDGNGLHDSFQSLASDNMIDYSMSKSQRHEIEVNRPGSQWNSILGDTANSARTEDGLVVTIDHICVLVDKVQNLNQGENVLCFRKLSATFWARGNEARVAFVENKGFEAWYSAIWHDMNDIETQLPAVEMLLALLICDAHHCNNWLDRFENIATMLDDVVEAVLIVMQTLRDNVTLQVAGFRLLASLASASGRNRDINDGTTAGAVNIVLTSMDMQMHSCLIREWGSRALYAQCTLSNHAQENRLLLAEAVLENSKLGPLVLVEALEASIREKLVVQWICALYACLSSSIPLARKLVSVTVRPLVIIIDLVREHGREGGSERLLEAALRAIGNMLVTSEPLPNFDVVDLLSLAIDVARCHEDDPRVCKEAYTLVATTAPTVSDKSCLTLGTIGIARCLIRCNIHDLATHMEALRALNSLLANCDLIQKQFWTVIRVDSVISISRLHVESEAWQGLSCSLFASLLEGSKFDDEDDEQEIISELGLIMSRHAEKVAVQEVASAVVCRISTSRQLSEGLVNDVLGPLMGAMAKFPCATQIQINGCLTIWNIASNGDHIFEVPSLIERCASCLVHTLQNSLERSSVVGVACRAMWEFVRESEDRKKATAKAGGIDALTCALVMHQNEVGILEKTCGVLASLSSSRQLITGIVDAQGISSIVDAVRNNPDAAGIMEYGSLFLKNIISEDASQAENIVDAIGAILRGLQTHVTNASLQKNACDFLLVISTASASCKSRVLALDAVSILMGVLSHHDENVQDAARGALNEIALSLDANHATFASR